MAEPSLLNAAVTVAFGALAGGLTNAVAIWMLFHPYDRRGPGPLKFHGAIPKNKPRLARTIGRTVGERLLTSEDLTQQLAAPAMREAFERAVQGFVSGLLEGERGPLRAEMPPALAEELDRIVEVVADTVADRVGEYVATDQFRETVARLLSRARDEYADRPIGELLTTARRTAIRTRVEQWVADAVRSQELERTIRAWLDRQMVTMAADQAPLLERLPRDLVAAVEREVAGYLPVALDRLAGLIRNPDSRARLQRGLHDLFQRFVRDLLLHERIVARLVVTEKTVARLLDNFEREGVDQFSQLLDEEEFRDQVARTINDAVVSFLQRPLAEHIQRLGAERVSGIADTAVRHIVAALQDPATSAYAVERLDQALQATEQRTWGQLLKHLPPERTASWVADAARTPRLRTWIADGTRAALTGLMDRPIGRPADWIPEGTVDRLAGRLAPALWTWIQEQVPVVIAQVDVQGMVEQKVLSFSVARMEEIVRRTTQRELDLIVRLGYVLGAVVGAIAYSLTLVLP